MKLAMRWILVFVGGVLAVTFVSRLVTESLIDSPWTAGRHEFLIAACALAGAALTGVTLKHRSDTRNGYMRKHELATQLGVHAAGTKGPLGRIFVGGGFRAVAALMFLLAPVGVVAVLVVGVGFATDSVLPGPAAAVWAITIAASVLTGHLLGGALMPSRRLHRHDVTKGVAVAGLVAALGAGFAARSVLEELATIVAVAVTIAVATGTAFAGRGAARSARLRAAWAGRVAAALGVPESRLADEDSDLRWGVTSNRIWIAGPLPQPMVTALPRLEELVATVLPEWEVQTANAEYGITLVRVSDDTAQSRAIATETGGLCLAETPGESTEFRPDAWDVTLSAAVTTEARVAEAVAAIERVRPGSRVVYVDRANRHMVRCDLDVETARVRDRIAEGLACAKHEVELNLTVDDGNVTEIVFAALPQIDPARRLARIASALDDLGVLADTEMWSVSEAKADRMLTATRMPRPTLPAMVSLEALLPDTITPDDWSTLPLGLGADSQPVCLDLLAGPHALVVGPTGSGKTVGLVSLASQALCRGHQLAIIDPTKAGLDFLCLRPYVTVWADTYATAQTAMTRIYAEGQRRKAVLQQLEVVKWSDATEDERALHALVPMTLVIDECGSLFLAATEPKGLPKDHPLLVDAQELNAAKAVITELAGRVARELRFVGIHLEVAMQRPDAKILSGELRSNLTSAVQLVAPGKPISPEALGMVFTADMVSSAYQQITSLDDGRSRGLAVVGAEGGTAQGLRVAYAPASDIQGLLDARGVPRVTTWDVTPEPTTYAPPAPTRAPRARQGAAH